ncbi:MAG: hypothetical protein H6983_25575 [Ectothiorhodospiraceae bacterium]|nr:hypothetical protein [Chromatiales bacterium]MCP5157572.1 hypothetical protein [Ectothiorhodospiraceae bacterium]
MAAVFPAGAGSTSPTAERALRSPAFRTVSERLLGDRRLSVLDLGPPMTATLGFFGQAPCRLCLEDLAADLLDWRPPQEGDAVAEAEVALARAFVHSARERFDLVLAWDLPCYLHPIMLGALTAHIRASIGPASLVHVVGPTGERIPARPARITVGRDQVLHYAPEDDRVMPGPRLSPGVLERLMPGLRLQHSFLLGEGLQEFLLALR